MEQLESLVILALYSIHFSDLRGEYGRMYRNLAKNEPNYENIVSSAKKALDMYNKEWIKDTNRKEEIWTKLKIDKTKKDLSIANSKLNRIALNSRNYGDLSKASILAKEINKRKAEVDKLEKNLKFYENKLKNLK